MKHRTEGNTRAPHTDPQRDSIFIKGPSDALDHATSEIAIGSKFNDDATKKLPAKVERLFGGTT